MNDPAAFKIGEAVRHLGRLHYVRGFGPMSLGVERWVELEDAATGERITVSVSEVEREPPGRESPGFGPNGQA